MPVVNLRSAAQPSSASGPLPSRRVATNSSTPSPGVQVAISTRMVAINAPQAQGSPPSRSHSQPNFKAPPIVPSDDFSVFSSSSISQPSASIDARAVTNPRPTSQPISAENRRPSTVARGNARPLEEQPIPSVVALNQRPPSQPAPAAPAPNQYPPQPEEPHTPVFDPFEDKATSVEFNPLQPKPEPIRVVPSAALPPQRPPTVTVGNSAVGGRSKKVVPLTDTRKR